LKLAKAKESSGNPVKEAGWYGLQDQPVFQAALRLQEQHLAGA